jgi:hypothetical protein
MTLYDGRMKLRLLPALIAVVLTPLVQTACNSGDSTGPTTLVWSSVQSGTTARLTSIWGTSASDIWAVGYNSILHYNGTSWSSITYGSPTLFGVWGSSASDVWAVGVSNTILHYDGSSWTTLLTTGSVATNFFGAWGTSPSDVWFVSSTGTNGPGDGMIHHYNGLSLSNAISATTPGLYGIWGSSGTDIWAVGDGGTILHGSPAK